MTRILFDIEENEPVAVVPDSMSLNQAIESHLKTTGEWNNPGFSDSGTGKEALASGDALGWFEIRELNTLEKM